MASTGEARSGAAEEEKVELEAEKMTSLLFDSLQSPTSFLV